MDWEKESSVYSGLLIRFRFRSESRSRAFKEAVKSAFNYGNNESLGHHAAVFGEQTDSSIASVMEGERNDCLRSWLCWGCLGGARRWQFL